MFLSPGFITKIFWLSEFALIGNWTVLALHGHKVTVTNKINDQMVWISIPFIWVSH